MRLPAHRLFPALLLNLATVSAVAQITTGTFSGRVLDRASGQPISKATVVLESPALFKPRVFATDAQGNFKALLLPVGTYTVKVSAAGHKTCVIADIRITVGATIHQEITLDHLPQEESTTVEVVSSMAFECNSSDKVAVNYSAEQLMQMPAGPTFNTEAYNPVEEQAFQDAMRHPLSTFSVDVDTASYSNMRRYIQGGNLPPKDAVRLEEWINYFHYDYPNPDKARPASMQTEVLACPWNPRHQLFKVGIQARRVRLENLPPRNLVFLLDVSGSMQNENKLPLVKAGLMRLCETLREIDRVAIVVYAGSSGLVLEPTSGDGKARILDALAHLEAGGSTNGAEGIQLAYEVARRNFQKDADNRVLLCTDGDFNVGVSDQGSLVRLIEKERKSGVFLTCLGFGMGNLKDATLEQLADKGNGHYGYIDSQSEMAKFFGEGGASLVTVAKDVKVQVEFNPSRVQSYRLLGYENRRLAAEDFKDDAKDAGEMSAGHSVTALFELVPPEAKEISRAVDPLKYQTGSKVRDSASQELLTVKIRYKKPDGFLSRQIEVPVLDHVLPWERASEDSRWAASVATFGLSLMDSPYKGQASLELAHRLAASAVGKDADGLRKEMLDLIEKARSLQSSAVK